MSAGTEPTFADADLVALRSMTKLGFDTSALNQLGRDPNIDALCAALVRFRCAPLLSAVSIVEMLKWADEAGRDALLAAVAKLRGVADFRLLPLPHEVVEAEFLARLRDQPVAVFGGQPISEGMQDILERAAARQAGWREAAELYTRAEQRSFTERILAARSDVKLFPEDQVPRSAAEFLHGLFGSRDALAGALNALFSPEKHGHSDLTADEAVQCVENLPALRAYFVSHGLAVYRHAVQRESTRKGAAGAIDIAQAAYLPLTDIFVVDDGGMYDHMQQVVLHARLSTCIVRYSELPGELSARAVCGLRAESKSR